MRLSSMRQKKEKTYNENTKRCILGVLDYELHIFITGSIYTREDLKCRFF